MHRVLRALIVSFVLVAPTAVFAGSQTYSTPGTYTFTVPAFNTMTVQVWGGGGGGGGWGGGGGGGSYNTVTLTPGSLPGTVSVTVGAGGLGTPGGTFGPASLNGGTGGTSSFGTFVYGYGGAGGAAYNTSLNYGWSSGGGGGGQSGVGQNSTANSIGGNGGAPSGGAGNAGNGYNNCNLYVPVKAANSTNGGGGGGGNCGNPGGSSVYGGGGGGGGINSYYGSTPTGGNSTYGGGGGGGGGNAFGAQGVGGSSTYGGTGGTGGQAYSYSSNLPPTNGTVPGGGGGGGSFVNSSTIQAGANGANGEVIITWTAPSCSVSATANPLTYGNTTSLNWSSANATTFYINNVGYVTHNNSSASTVGPLTTTNYTGTAVGIGGTTTCPYTLTVTAPLNCTFNGNTVNSGSSVTAYSTSQVVATSSCSAVSQQRTCTNGVLSGTYTNASCNVAPLCSVSVSPPAVQQGNSSTLSWTSTAASSTSCTGTNFATGSAISGSTSVSPATTTTYSASCVGPGGTTSCTSGTLTVTCTPTYSCTGSGNQTIHYTDNSCNISTTTTCVSPQFCSPGSSVCLNPNPSFNSSGSLTGHLQIRPSIVAKGNTTKIYWNVSNVLSCSVTGSNHDAWSTMTSPPSGATSSAITALTTYTLTCLNLPSGSSSETETQTVGILPSFQEK